MVCSMHTYLRFCRIDCFSNNHCNLGSSFFSLKVETDFVLHMYGPVSSCSEQVTS
jgi:hypothetical protein